MFVILINIQMFGICPYKKNFLFFVLANYKSIIFYSCVSLDTFEPIYLMTMHIINPLANWMLTHKTLTLSLSWIHGPVNLVSASNPLPLPPYDPSPQNSTLVITNTSLWIIIEGVHLSLTGVISVDTFEPNEGYVLTLALLQLLLFLCLRQWHR